MHLWSSTPPQELSPSYLPLNIRNQHSEIPEFKPEIQAASMFF
ncbi:MAG: hypothetical protein U5L01_10240 [Rheinheimera sp.]|nr:hypothetical protein [Rheinheimera sp.]